MQDFQIIKEPDYFKRKMIIDHKNKTLKQFFSTHSWEDEDAILEWTLDDLDITSTSSVGVVSSS